MSRLLIPAAILVAVAAPASGQPKKKDETVSKEWVARTAALPADQQIDTVRAKLRELFGPHVGFQRAEIKDGAVVEVVVAGMPYVEDVGPLAAFKKLEKLVMRGGKVKDLAPLKGLPLKFLDCSANQIAGLDPVRGMPLEVLKCQAQTLRKTPDDWLAPVASLKGLKELACSGVRVHPLNGSGLKLEVLWTQKCIWPKAGIGLLKGMPLRELSAREALTIDPAVLRGQPVPGSPGDVAPLKTLTGLEMLDLTENKAVGSLDWAKALPKLRTLTVGRTGVASLDPLKGARALTSLAAPETPVASLEPLRGLKLTSLDLSTTRVTDLGPLVKMPLENLRLQNTKVRDLRPLAGLPLKQLSVAATLVDDLTPLAGLKLTSVWVGTTPVKSLAPLQGMPLGYIELTGTPVNDLSPLRGMPLEYVQIMKTPVRDFSVFPTLDQLQRLDIDLTMPGLIPVLRRVKSLKTINALPAADQLN